MLCLPQAMWLTYQAIMDRPDLGQDEILDLVTPVTMRDRTPQRGSHASRALAALREFGLVTRDADGLHRADKVGSAQDFLRLLRRRLLAPPETVGADFAGAPDLRLGLIWLMRQSPLTPLDFETNVARSMPAGLFTNDTRWNAFRWWSQALGLGRPALTAMAVGASQKTSGEKIIPDPTEAVIDVIAHPTGDPIPRGQQVPIAQLLSFLRTELPVLPGHPSATHPAVSDRGAHDMRPLGLALSSAEARNILTMEYQSDPSGVMALPDARDHGRNRYVSAVTIRG